MDGESFLRKKSGKIFTSRPHGKVEKREQRKAWKKRKQERISQKKKREEQRKAQTVEHVEESLQVEDASKQLDQSRASTSKPAAFKPRQLEITRGNVMLAMARKRTLPVTRKELLKPAPPKVQKKAIAARKEKCHSGFRELSRELLVINKSKAVGSGSFGKCYSASYREEFRVAVKIFKTKNSSAKVLEQAKREALHEAMVISQLGDHHGIPHLFGVCTDKAPFYLVLQFYSVDGQTSSTLTESLKNGNIKEASDCVSVLRNIVETLTFIHSHGYVHNDLKGNNVLLTRSPSGTLRPIIIDFGKSEEIASAHLPKPKVDFARARKNFPHVAPEIHRGERPSVASDVFSFGALVLRALKDGGFKIPLLKEVANSCMEATSSKRPELTKVLEKICLN